MPSALQGNMDTLVLTGAGLPATTAIAGLLGVGATAIDILSDLNTSPQVTAAVHLCLREVKECRSSVHALYRTLSLLENAQVPFPARAEWIGLEELVATLTDAVLAFSRVYSLCLALDAEAARSSPEYASKVFEKRLRALSARIRWHNLSIAMMMTIINCPGEKDAINSRDELAHRTNRLLTFNLGLSSRMRRGSRPPSSSAKSPAPDAQPTESPELFPTQVGPLSDIPSWPTVFSGQTLAERKVLSRIALPVSLSELREDREYYPVGFLQQTGGLDYPRGGVLLPAAHEFMPGQQAIN